MHQNKNNYYHILATLTFLLLISLACGFGPTGQLPETVEVEALQKVEDQPFEKNSPYSAIFKTPEEAINYYFEGLAQADICKIMEACAIDEMAEKSSFELYTERAAFLDFGTLAPTDYPLYVELNKANLSKQVLDKVTFFAYSLLTSEEVYDFFIRMDTEGTNQFVIDINPERLAEIEVQQIDLPNKAQMNSDEYIQDMADMAGFYGADEATERVVLFTFEGDYYYVGFRLLRYVENWKISWQVSTMANTNRFGAAQKTTIEEFEALVNDD